MFWKIYFWAVAILTALAYGTVAAKLTLVDWISLAALTVAITGLFCHAYNKKLGSKRQWQSLLVISAVYYLAYSFYLDGKFGGVPSGLGGELFSIAMLFPAYWATYVYAFKPGSR